MRGTLKMNDKRLPFRGTGMRQKWQSSGEKSGEAEYSFAVSSLGCLVLP